MSNELDALLLKEKEVKDESINLRREFELKEEKEKEASDNLFKKNEDISRIKNRIDMLTDMENNHSLSPKAVKEIIDAKLSSVSLYGTVASLLKTESKYSIAIDTALGANANNVVCESEEDAKRAIEYLKKNKAGRVTFMPVASVKPSNKPGEDLSKEDGYIGIASSLVSCDGKYKNVIESLLGRTFVFKDIDTAIKVSKKFKQSVRMVTLTGELFNVGGSITGGEFKNKLGAMQVNAEITTLKKDYEKALKDKEELEKALSEIKENKEKASEKLHKNEEIGKNINEQKIEALSKLKYENELYDSILNDIKASKDELSETKEKIKDGEIRKAEFEKEIAVCEKELKEIEALISKTDDSYSNILEKKDEINEKISNMRFKISEKEKDINYEQDKINLIEKEKENFVSELSKKTELIKEAEDKILDIKDDIEFRTAQITEATESIVEYKKKIEENKEEKTKKDKELSHCQKKSNDLTEKFVIENEAHSKLEVKVNKINTDIEQTVNNLWESYELTITTAEELKKDIGSHSSAVKKISELKGKIKALGNINIDAIEEYKAVNERYTFLIAQRDDLTEAKLNLETIISDMIKLMKQIFTEQFALIAKSFNDTYIELFGGGRAELRLTEPENVLESGIEIEVQPPGKKLTTISLLSGGEKAFTAIALLFSIIKVKPTPFCMFDEIEAALDDNNVYRYADYLTKFKKDTQFIVITHRRGTMESADTLYGVTMQEKGVSKLLSINIDEIEKEGLKK